MVRIIGGEKKGLRLKIPATDLRPLTDQAKEALFNILAPYVQGARFLDLFSGSGSVAIEALSRGAQIAFLVEKNRTAVQIIRENLAFTKLNAQAEIFSLPVKKALGVLESKGAKFDLVYIGAPYDSPELSSSLQILGTGKLLEKDSLVIAEHRFQHKIEKAFGSIFCYDERRYGDTVFSFYRMRTL